MISNLIIIQIWYMLSKQGKIIYNAIMEYRVDGNGFFTGSKDMKIFRVDL